MACQTSIKPYEYQLHACHSEEGKHLKLRNFPELNIEYLSHHNSLCPSHYCEGTCTHEGDLSITLFVNGQLVTICNRDRHHKEVHKVCVGDFDYMFQGVGAFVDNKSKALTYLVFQVVKTQKSDHAFTFF